MSLSTVFAFGLIASQTGSTAFARGPSPAPSYFIGQNVNMSRLAGSNSESTIAIDPTDPNRVVATAMRQTKDYEGLVETRSTDGGATWTSTIIGAGDNLGFICCDESLAWDDYGNLFFVYLEADAPVHVALSTDGGLTFNQITTIDAVTSPGNTDQPTVKTRRSPRRGAPT